MIYLNFFLVGLLIGTTYGFTKALDEVEND